MLSVFLSLWNGELGQLSSDGAGISPLAIFWALKTQETAESPREGAGQLGCRGTGFSPRPRSGHHSQLQIVAASEKPLLMDLMRIKTFYETPMIVFCHSPS